MTEAEKDAARLDWLQEQARKSRTGISFDWIPSVDGEASGYRFMRHHRVDEPYKDIRKAIDAAMEKTK